MIRWMTRVVGGGHLSVFLFHKVPRVADPLLPGDLDLEGFEQLLDLIKAYFDIVPLSEGATRLSKGLPASPIAAITFDDGYPEWKDGVVQVLLRRGIPATFFITVGQFFGRPMWHERLANIVRATNSERICMQQYKMADINLGTARERIDALKQLEFQFKYLPLGVRDEFIAELESGVGTSSEVVARMDASDLLVIADAGFEIGAHTVDHPILGLCNLEESRDEIGRTREILEGMIKRPVRSFAYPNGRPLVDFNWRHLEQVRSAGYDYAVTTHWGVARNGTSQFQIPRFTPWGPSRFSMALQLMRNAHSDPGLIAENT